MWVSTQFAIDQTITRFINHMQNTSTRKQMDMFYLIMTSIAPYSNVGTTWASKTLKNTLAELQLIFLRVARISIVPFLPLTAMPSVAAEKLILVERVSHKYLYELTTSSLFPHKKHLSLTPTGPPFLKTITSDLFRFRVTVRLSLI